MNLIKLIKEKHILIILTFLIVPAILPFLSRGYFPSQDIIHVLRIEQMYSALLDGQFPVRWVSGLRYGEPLFNFYAPLPYYFGSIIKFVGFSYVETSKILFIIGVILTSFSMYAFASKLFGRAGGIISALLYTYAPYHAVDIYVRGALSENFSFVFLPLIFLYSYRTVTEDRNTKSNWSLLTLSLSGLFLTHNVTAFIFMPFIIIWMGLSFFNKRTKNKFIALLTSVVISVGAAAFYLLPALTEKQYIQSSFLTDNYFNFRAHFLAVGQWISSFWGYGASVWGREDGLSFQIGKIQILLGLIGLVATSFVASSKKYRVYLIFFFLATMLSLFMQHNQSTFIWEKISLLQFVQFPWRFLSVSIFFISLLGGLTVVLIRGKYRTMLLSVIAIAVIAANISFFKPDYSQPDAKDADYILKDLKLQNEKLPKDYLPVWVKEISDNKKTTPFSEDGTVQVADYYFGSSIAEFKTNMLQENVVVVPIYYFPGWTVRTDGVVINQEKPTEEGFINFKLTPGVYNIKIVLEDTASRSWGNYISLVSLIVMGGMYITGKKPNIFRKYLKNRIR